MNKSISRATRAALWTLALASPTWAQDDAPPVAPPTAPPATTPAKPADAKPADAKPADAKAAASKAKLEIIAAGELRIDGKVTAILGEGVWQVEAVSWTSPRGVTTNFDDLKTKAVAVGATSYLHPRGEELKVPLKQVTLGSRVGIIGKNGPDGALIAREVVLLEGYGVRKMVGTLTINPFSSTLIDQSRKAREAGQLAKALELADKAAVTAQGLGDRSGEGLATQDKVLLQLDLGKTQEAFVGMKRQEAIGREINNTLLLSMGLAGQGRLLLRSGQYSKSISLLQEADPVSVNAPSTIHQEVLQSLAIAYLASGDVSQGIGTLSRIFPLEQAAGKEADAGETRLQIAMLQAEERPDVARQILTESQPLIERTTDEKAKAGLVGAAALVHFRLGEKDEATTGFTQAAELLTAAGDAKGAKEWQGMAAKLETAPADTQGFWLVASGLGDAVKAAADGTPPDDTPAA